MGVEDIVITVAGDGSRAIIQQMPSGTDVEDIKFALQVKGVKNGILWDNISRALTDNLNEEKEIRNLTAAESTSPESSWEFSKEIIKDGEKGFADRLDLLKKAGAELENIKQDAVVNNRGVFIKRGEVFLRIEHRVPAKDIFGNEKNAVVRIPEHDSETVRVRKRGEDREFVALKSGYLISSHEKVLKIIEPFVISKDKLKMSYSVFPVKYGKDALIEDMFKRLDKISAVEDVHPKLPERKEIEKSIDEGIYRIYTLGKGKKPVYGRKGSLTYHITGNIDKDKKSDKEKVDPRDLTPFHEVKKGDIIAVLIPSRLGKNGMDIYGNEIPVEQVDEVTFNPGDNLDEVKNDDKIEYKAEADGVAIMTDEGVSVSEELVIDGDVGPDTGNIRYSRDIIVKGNVLGGFKVICGRDLSIHGNVENGSEISCKGKTDIRNTLFGNRTRFITEGNVSVGTLHECNIRIKGDLEVKNYIYNSYVICGKKLRVEGRGISDDTRGAVIGGRICTMDSMDLHSVGSASAETILYCGVDVDAKEALKIARDAEFPLSRRMVSLQSSIGVNIHDPSASDKLRRMPLAMKTKIKERVSELKKLIGQHEKLTDRINKLENKAYAKNIEELEIKIQKHLVPDVRVYIGGSAKLVRESVGWMKFRILEGRIVTVDL